MTENVTCRVLRIDKNLANILVVNDGIVLSIGGTGYLQGPTTFNTNIISTSNSGRIRFIGNSRTLFNSSWWGAGSSAWNWRCEIALNTGQTGTASTNIKMGELLVTSGGFTVGTSGTPRNLYLDGTGDGTGTATISSVSNAYCYRNDGNQELRQ